MELEIEEVVKSITSIVEGELPKPVKILYVVSVPIMSCVGCDEKWLRKITI